jgi:hypothetical protein
MTDGGITEDQANRIISLLESIDNELTKMNHNIGCELISMKYDIEAIRSSASHANDQLSGIQATLDKIEANQE